MIGLYEEKEQEYGPDLLREVEQSVMLQVIDTRWLAYLTQMDHLREGMGFQAYGQMDPLVEYKAAAFTAFQDLTEDIQREIVRAFALNVQIRRVDPNAATGAVDEGAPQPVAAAPAPGAADATAPPSPRADRPAGATDGAQVPPARPAAALASGALARATGARVTAPLTSQPAVRNIVELSSGGDATCRRWWWRRHQRQRHGQRRSRPAGQGWTQSGLPVRVGEEVQVLPRQVTPGAVGLGVR